MSKALSVTAFFGLTLAPVDGPVAAGRDPIDPGIVVAPVAAAAPGALGRETDETDNPSGTRATGAASASKAKTGEAPPTAGTQGSCATGMVLVDGEYCPDAEQFVILKVLDKTIGLRVTVSDEREGLDTTQHGEEGYAG